MLFLCSWSHCLNCIRGTRARSSIWPCSGSACNTCKHSAQRNVYAHNHSACCVCCAQPGLQTIRRCAMDLFWQGRIGRHWPVLYTCISVWRSYHNIGLRDVSIIYQKFWSSKMHDKTPGHHASAFVPASAAKNGVSSVYRATLDTCWFDLAVLQRGHSKQLNTKSNNPSATSCWCWTVSKVLKASSSFGFFFGRVKKWICCTYTRLKNAHDDNSMHHTTSFLHAVTMFRVMSITLQELSLMLGSMLHCRDFQFHTGQALSANMQSLRFWVVPFSLHDSKTNR